MLLYASPSDFATWTGEDAPAGITGLLRTASLAVREATELAFYATDSDGYPTDPVKREGMRDATCCQAAALSAAGIDPNFGGVLDPGVESSTGIGSARITFADAAAAAEAKQMLLRGLCVDAQRILRNAGLSQTAPWIVG